MTKGTQLWPGARMRDFFLTLIRRETPLDEASAGRLADALMKPVNRMLVFEMPAPETPKKAPPAKPQAGATARSAPSTASGDASTFNPFVFSAMVVLAKTGREGLAKRLADIKSVEHLRALADAQHLGIDRKLTKIDDVRKAVLAAAEQRLADRKAAAS